MDANLAIVAVSAVALVGLFFAAIVWARGTRDSDVTLERERRERAEALAAHRGELLDEAKRLLDEASDGSTAAVARHAELEDAMRTASPGARLDAVERMLQQRAAGRRARREADARVAAAGAPASGPAPVDPARADGSHA